MQYQYVVYTDPGRVKDINQDAAIVMQAETRNGPFVMAAVCDGMGGLTSGEEASAMMIEKLEGWFCDQLPVLLLTDGIGLKDMEGSITELIRRADYQICEYGKKHGGDCGTTVTAVLIYQNEWMAVNVGDSRVYLSNAGTMHQVTKDHTYVQREIDAGRMTKEEARVSKMRSTLTACVGAAERLTPDYFFGIVEEETVMLLCSDGFRHILSLEEFESRMDPNHLVSEKEMYEILKSCAEESMEKGERDNITAILIH